ncbi:XRCC4-like factor-domain-containing protein [Trichophaea hybrida]|nr:XRCC4-like factor-domain-containing protein [Trichophaea hybrida]
MSFPRKTAWHILPLTTSIRSAPPLLVKTDFTSNSYAVHITDLCQVWSETLDCASILSRASREGTTIDPSEDVSQLQLLLEKLESALHSPSQDVELVLNSTHSVAGSCDLRLKLTSELPPPLPELEWTFTMKQGSMMNFTNEFVLPLASMASLHTEQIKSLLGTIQEKDKVIEKLKDALEDSKVKVDVIVGTRRRKALVPFDKAQFDAGYRDVEEKSGREVVRDVFGSDANPKARPVGQFTPGAVEWWKGVENDDEEPYQSSIKAAPGLSGKDLRSTKKQGKVSIKVGSETEDKEDEFEVLKTPTLPPLPLTSHRSATNPGGADDETDDDDLDGGMFLTASPPPLKSTVEDRKSLPTPAFTSNNDEATTRAKPPAPKRTIGKIGGHKVALASIQSPVSDNDQPAFDRNKRAIQKAKIGSVGGVKKTIDKIGENKGSEEMELGQASPIANAFSESSTVAATMIHPLSPPSHSSRSQPAKLKIRPPISDPEDEDEKADRKRHLLEKELEAKKKQPQKKKRKF